MMSGRPSPVSSVVLVADMSQVAVARSFVRDALHGVAAAVGADVQLIVSELVTNAFEYGDGSPVTLVLQTDERGVRVTVDSAGRPDDVDHVDRWTVAQPDSIGGRGLGIVRTVADSVDVSRDPARLSIMARRDF